MIEFVCACVFVWNKSHINTAQTTYCNPFFSVLEHVSSSIRTSFITTGVISHRLSISLTSSKRRSIKEVSIKLHHHQQQSRLQKEEIKTNQASQKLQQQMKWIKRQKLHSVRVACCKSTMDETCNRKRRMKEKSANNDEFFHSTVI